MDYFLVEGGHKLSGQIRIPGAKNAALPMLCGALLTEEVCVFRDVPEISDIARLLEIFEEMGVQVVRDLAAKTVEIQARNIDLKALAASTNVKKFRASILILGPLLARCGECSLQVPGGCVLGARSLAVHFNGLRELGAEIKEFEDHIEATFNRSDFASDRVLLPEASVTGTENLALFLAGNNQTAELFFTAAEPHVCGVLEMLGQMGAKVQGIGTHHLQITGNKKLTGGEFVIPPDGILVGTYAIAGILAGEELEIQNVNHVELLSFYGALKKTGAKFQMEDNVLRVFGTEKLQAVSKIQTAIYPGFTSDLQSPMGLLLTQCEGESMIFETLYEGRFTYLSELEKMGAKIELLNAHQARVFGKADLKGTEVQSWDLRAGAAMVLAGLIAEGQTKVTNIDYIDRGYEHFEQNLTALGAKITRVEEALLERQHGGLSPNTADERVSDPHSQSACKSAL